MCGARRRRLTTMRIALLTRRFDPSGGGTERDLIVTAAHLRRAGHEITVYANEVRGTSGDLRVKRVGSATLPRALAVIRFAYAAPREARAGGAELVLSFGRTVGADILRPGGGVHASYLSAARRWRGGAGALAMNLAPYHRAQMLVERRGFRAPELRKAIAVSNFVRDDLIRCFGLPAGRAVTLYNGVDLDRFRPRVDDSARREVRARHRIADDARVVAFAGNGFGRKGLGRLIDVWPGVGAEAYLLVVGGDRAAASFRERAARAGVAERVIFTGSVADVAPYFHSADAFALPSLFEPFGNVVMEAMASGIPALSSAMCGVAELMPPELREFVVADPGDASEIARRVAAMLAAGPEAGRIARATAEGFTWERYGRELDAIIASVAR
jgi:UDP-glucose:(heptosyl)LPS alpha-1,3-glucosyltransferase